MRVSKAHFVALLTLLMVMVSCNNPYKGFKGVNKKGMSTRKTPSQELKEDYEDAGKKMQRRYKREMKRKKKKYGHSNGQ